MANTLFAITSEGSTQHYHTENFGDLLEILALLHTVRSNMERNLGSRLTAAGHLTSTSKNLLPISVYPSQQLFQPLKSDESTVMFHKFRTNRSDGQMISVDYDANYFEYTEWTRKGLEVLSGPLDGVTAAYGAALRKKNSSQTYLNDKVFIAEMERICTINTLDTEPELIEPGTPQITM